MTTINAIAAGINMLALFFVVFATASASRPTKAKKRGIEFGIYFACIALLTAFNVPPAQIVYVDGHLADANSLLPALRTFIGSLALVRIGVIMLGMYGQRRALEKYIAAREPTTLEVLERA